MGKLGQAVALLILLCLGGRSHGMTIAEAKLLQLPYWWYWGSGTGSMTGRWSLSATPLSP